MTENASGSGTVHGMPVESAVAVEIALLAPRCFCCIPIIITWVLCLNVQYIHQSLESSRNVIELSMFPSSVSGGNSSISTYRFVERGFDVAITSALPHATGT